MRRTSRSRPARGALFAALLALGVTACGTTVPMAGTALDGSASGLEPGFTDPLTGEAVADPLGGDPLAGAPTGTAVGGSASTGGATTGVGADPSGSSDGPTTTAPTVAAGTGKRAPVRLGFTTVPDAAAFFASFGASMSSADQAAMIRSAVAWVNKNGGLNGHPIDPYIAEVSATSEEPYDQQYQRLCAEYTQDAKVIAASNVGIGANTNMDECMNKANTLFLTGSNTLHDEVSYQRTPLVVSPMEVSVTVLAKTIAQLIVARGFEKSGGKVGLLNYDLPEYKRAVDQQFKPILAAAGIGLVQYTIPPPASTAEIGNSVAVVQSAQLRMASEGVKTATFLCAGCAGFFIQSATSQNYYPRYVLSSLDTPGGADGSTYERALRSSVSVGWLPVQDYSTTTPPAPVSFSPTYDLCYKIQKEAGQITDAASVPIAILTCDAVLSFYQAAKANPVSPITAISLRDGLLKLGTSHTSGLSFGTNLSPRRHAGAHKYRLMTWNDTCSCPAYSGPALSFPSV